MVATLSSVTMACVGSDELGEEEVGTVDQAFVGANGLGWNGLGSNGLGSNGLRATALSSNQLAMTALIDPLAQQLLKYVTSCALDGTQDFTLTINSAPVTFTGLLGLAPTWGLSTGSCGPDCVSWVSGCVMARVNFLGEHVPLSIRGNATLESTAAERTAYPLREGAYFGDLFSDPPKRYACTEQGSTLVQRACGSQLSTCIMKVVGNCQDFCDAPDALEGKFANCRDDLGRVYPGTITIYRQNGQ